VKGSYNFTITLILLLGLIVTGTLYYLARASEQRHIDNVFQWQANLYSHAIELELTRNSDAIEAIARLYSASEHVNRHEFKQFSQLYMLEHIDIQALEWIPKVKHSERADFIRRAQQWLPEFQFTEINSKGELQKAAIRKEYFPVYFIEPLKGNEKAVGLDLMSQETRRSALKKAADTGAMIATKPVKLVQDGAMKNGLLVMKAVYKVNQPLHTVEQRRKNLSGYVLGVFNISKLVAVSLKHLQVAGMHIHFQDEAMPNSSQISFLHSFHPHDHKAVDDDAGISFVTRLGIADRMWRFSFYPTESFLNENSKHQAWVILIFGVILTGLLVMFFTLLNRQKNSSDQLAAERLQANKELQESQGVLREKLIDLNRAEAAALNMMEDANMAREQLALTQIEHEEAQRQAHLGHWILDLIHNELFWSDEEYRIFGAEPGKANSYETFLKTVHPADREFVDHAFTGAVKNRTPYDIEHRLLMQDGSIKWVIDRCQTEYADDGTALRAVGTTLDITERKAIEDVLQLNVNELESLAQASRKILGLRQNDDLYTLISDAALEIFDLKLSWLGFIQPDSKEIHVQAISGISRDYMADVKVSWDDSPQGCGPAGLALKNAQPVIENDIEHGQSFQDWRKLAMQHGFHSNLAVPLICKKNKMLGVLSLYSHEVEFFSDRRVNLLVAFANQAATAIENERLMESLEDRVRQRTQELEVARDQAQAANRAKSTFLANMSHELRTPLNSILGFSELLSMDTTDPLQDEQKTYLSFITESGGRLLNLINDLLDLSKIEAGKMDMNVALFDIRELLNHTIESHQQTFEKQNLSYHCDCDKELTMCSGDIHKIQQVLDNLFSNAIKFTPAGGHVEIVAKRITRAEIPVYMPNVSADEFIQVSIIDSGIGIRLEDHGRLFQPYQQLDGQLNRKYEGTGLGLALCRKIINMHNGELFLETSEPDKGSTFTFVIPNRVE